MSGLLKRFGRRGAARSAPTDEDDVRGPEKLSSPSLDFPQGDVLRTRNMPPAPLIRLTHVHDNGRVLLVSLLRLLGSNLVDLRS